MGCHWPQQDEHRFLLDHFMRYHAWVPCILQLTSTPGTQIKCHFKIVLKQPQQTLCSIPVTSKVANLMEQMLRATPTLSSKRDAAPGLEARELSLHRSGQSESPWSDLEQDSFFHFVVVLIFQAMGSPMVSGACKSSTQDIHQNQHNKSVAARCWRRRLKTHWLWLCSSGDGRRWVMERAHDRYCENVMHAVMQLGMQEMSFDESVVGIESRGMGIDGIDGNAMMLIYPSCTVAPAGVDALWQDGTWSAESKYDGTLLPGFSGSGEHAEQFKFWKRLLQFRTVGEIDSKLSVSAAQEVTRGKHQQLESVGGVVFSTLLYVLILSGQRPDVLCIPKFPTPQLVCCPGMRHPSNWRALTLQKAMTFGAPDAVQNHSCAILMKTGVTFQFLDLPMKWKCPSSRQTCAPFLASKSRPFLTSRRVYCVSKIYAYLIKICIYLSIYLSSWSKSTIQFHYILYIRIPIYIYRDKKLSECSSNYAMNLIESCRREKYVELLQILYTILKWNTVHMSDISSVELKLQPCEFGRRSLGVIFHILLTGQFPFSTSEDAIFKVRLGLSSP